uniref:Tropomyosin n=1 Tax=Panagrolaimus superbus TaxID=310955 RepID=A0A914YKQ1_9BILA
MAEVKNENDSLIQSLQAKIDVLGNDKDELQKAFDEKCDEVKEIKSDAENKRAEFNAELSRLIAQLSKTVAEVREYETEANAVKNEVDELQTEIDSLNLRLIEAEKQKDIDIEILKADLINISAAKDDEINQHKIVAEKEKTELQDELARLNDQLLKATEEIEEYKTATENAQKEIGDLQAIVTKGKEILNARIAEVKNENDSLIQSLQAEIDVLGNDKDELQKAFDEKCDEAKQLKINAENEKAEFDVELSRLIDQLSKTTADAEEYKAKTDAAKKEIDDLSAANEKLKTKISKLYDDLDEADAEKKESSELIFNLTTKLSKYIGEDGAEIRAGIDMGEVMSPRPPPSPDTSFKSVAEEPQPSSSQLDNDDNEKDVTPTKSKGIPKRK